MMWRPRRLLAENGWVGGSAAAGGPAGWLRGVSSRMTLETGALRFQALDDSATSTGGAGAGGDGGWVSSGGRCGGGVGSGRLRNKFYLSSLYLLDLVTQLYDVKRRGFGGVGMGWLRVCRGRCLSFLRLGRCWHGHLDRNCICHVHLPHVMFAIPARAEDGVFIAAEGGHGLPAIEELCFGQQVWATNSVRIFTGDVPLRSRQAKCILDGVVINVLKGFRQLVNAGLIFRQVQNFIDGCRVGRNEFASYVDHCVFSGCVVGIKLPCPIDIDSGRFSANFQPAEAIEVFVDDHLQPIVVETVIELESLLFP
ncbi:hypothetical protein V6N12_073376 [Hibiscus sabdariffa]|uniref:Uncharacterized protein n=1 Tax=Hibiscus sabdariffa TaxID=183260 RepID=A0ABR2BT90_9ROSI